MQNLHRKSAESFTAEAVETYLPSDGITLPRGNRLETLDQLQVYAMQLMQQMVFREGHYYETSEITAMATYCNLPALRDMALYDQVQRPTAEQVYEDYCCLGSYHNEFVTDELFGDSRALKGFWAEVAIAKLFWGAVADDFDEDSYAFLLGTIGLDRGGEARLRDDIDARARLGGKKYNLQVKLHKKRTRQIYKDGITLISPMDIAPGRSATGALKQVMALHEKPRKQRIKAYTTLQKVLERRSATK